MKKIRILFSFSTIVLLIACGKNSMAFDPELPPARPAATVDVKPDTADNFSYYLDPRLPLEVREVVMENRRRLFVYPNPDFSANPGKYINLDYDENVDKSIVETLKNPVKPMVKNGKLALDIIEKELDFLMDYLKYAYGAYEYYGGDEVFHALKETIIEELKDKYGAAIAVKAYRKALYKHLSAAIVDCHFVVDDSPFWKDQRHAYFLLSEQYIFQKKENQFYTDIDGIIFDLISVDGLAPNLLPYLNKDGEMVWVIGESAITDKNQSRSIVLLDEAGDRALEKNITLKAAYGDIGQITDFLYYEYEKNGIKIAESRRCVVTSETGDMVEAMNMAGQGLRGENVVVVDVRNNYGGNSIYPQSWLEGYLGHEVSADRGSFAARHTETTYYTSSIDSAYNETLGTYAQFMEFGDYPYWQGPAINPAAVNNNKDTLFIIITNAKTGSAGEDFVDFLRQTENTIVVGANTSGAYMTGNVTSIHLPYSQTFLRCGYNLHLEPDLSSIEGKGIQPDIWAPPWDSLDRVLKFIENYGLGEALE